MIACLYIAYTACGSASLYIKALYFFLTVLALSAAATVANIKIRYDAKITQFAIFGTRVIYVFYSSRCTIDSPSQWHTSVWRTGKVMPILQRPRALSIKLYVVLGRCLWLGIQWENKRLSNHKHIASTTQTFILRGPEPVTSYLGASSTNQNS